MSTAVVLHYAVTNARRTPGDWYVTALDQNIALVHAPSYDIDLGGLEQIHPFDVHKYSKIRQQLVRDGVVAEAAFLVPEELRPDEILLVHTPDFLASLGDAQRVAGYLEFPVLGMLPPGIIDQGIIRAFRHSSGGTILAAREALRRSLAINLGGGYHHASPSHGDGFCVFADVPIALRVLQREGRLRRAMIVDLDVHQGDGSILCCREDASIFTFSMHEGNLYPIPKQKGSLDLELEAHTGDERYLELLARHLPVALDSFRPELLMLIAGCDTLAGDPLAHLAMSPEGIARRDAYVIDECRQRGIAVAMLLGGGYSPEAWQVQYRSIRQILSRYGTTAGRVAQAT